MALHKNLLKNRLPPISADMSSKYGKRGLRLKDKDYSPVQWMNYFDRTDEVTINENKFRVYCSGNEGPLLVLLHGGGFSALTWALFTREITNRVVCQVLAIDLRGHGDTVTTDDGDLSKDTQASDVGDIVNVLFGNEPPQIILIGHSMGGAIAVHTSSKGLIPSLVGLCVIDVVEGTAIQALASMQSYLRGRPKLFRSIDYAIEWAFRSGHTRNLESAKVSMPGQLKNISTGIIATNEVLNEHATESEETATSPISNLDSNLLIEEEDENESTNNKNIKSPDEDSADKSDTFRTPDSEKLSAGYTWRIDLSKTEQYWTGWFEGLSNLFLNEIPAPKMLLLASINGLDTDLTVGQMQGKFQMQVLPRCGHAVQEDVPDQVADVLASFMLRNKLTSPCGEFVRTFPSC